MISSSCHNGDKNRKRTERRVDTNITCLHSIFPNTQLCPQLLLNSAKKQPFVCRTQQSDSVLKLHNLWAFQMSLNERAVYASSPSHTSSPPLPSPSVALISRSADCSLEETVPFNVDLKLAGMFLCIRRRSSGMNLAQWNVKVATASHVESHTHVNVCWSCAGVPVSSRVSAKIQQLVNTLKRPKRRPLREFFVDDFEELLEGNDFTLFSKRFDLKQQAALNKFRSFSSWTTQWIMTCSWIHALAAHMIMKLVCDPSQSTFLHWFCFIINYI